MKLKISDMMDHVENIPVEIREKDIASTKRIKEATMRKIHQTKSNNHSAKRWGSMVACFCLCALLGVGAWQSGMLNPQQPPVGMEQVGSHESSPNTHEDQPPAISSPVGSSEGVGGNSAAPDVQGRVVWQGVDYIQIDIVSGDQVTLGEYLGEVADFEGPYKDAGVAGGLYTVADNENLLCAKLEGRFFENGDYVLLEKLH